MKRAEIRRRTFGFHSGHRCTRTAIAGRRGGPFLNPSFFVEVQKERTRNGSISSRPESAEREAEFHTMIRT
ncbi:MAG: hypothetical protein C6W57_10670 [Caldibacillus debilis]|nr:MAG: hypothetical protein C6W57_10670 [Caldibacillus debilis]